MMQVLVVEPERRPEVREIDGTLKSMQEIVGGLIQPVYPFDDDNSAVLVCNDEGKLMNLPANRGLRDGDGQIYDIVIFGYLSAVQQYFRDPPPNVAFEAMPFRAMKDSILRDGEYRSRAKRCGITIRLDDFRSTLADPKQDTEQQVADKVILEQVVDAATPQEARILHLLMDGFVLREAAWLLKMPKATVVSCMEEFCCRTRAAIG